MEQSYIEVVPVSVEEAAKKFNEEFGQSYNIYRCHHSDSTIYVWHHSYKKQFILGKEVKHTEYMGYPVFYYENRNNITVAPIIRNPYSIIIQKENINIEIESDEYYLIKNLLQADYNTHFNDYSNVFVNRPNLLSVFKAFKINTEN